METQQQLLHNGEGFVSQRLSLSNEDTTRGLASCNHNGDHEWRMLNRTNPTPFPGICEIPAAVTKFEDKGNGDQRIQFSPPPAVSAVKDGAPYDPERVTYKKKHKNGGWITTPFIFGTEAAERLAVSGSHVNLISYLVNEMHQKTLQSATIINTFSSTSAWAPLLGAFVADSYLGRFATILYASFIYLAGLILITMSAVMPSLQPRECEMSEGDDGVVSTSCVPANSLQIGVVYVALSLMVVGSGGIRPCVSPFGASQFDPNDPKENADLKSYFNWYYFTVTAAGLVASTVIVYIQDNVSWGWGFGISAAVMMLSIASFMGGSCFYRFSFPRGSAYTRMAQVLVAAVRKRHLVVPSDSILLYYGNFVDDEGSKPTSSRNSSRTISSCNSSENSIELKVLSNSKAPQDDSAFHSRKVSKKLHMVSNNEDEMATGGGGEAVVAPGGMSGEQKHEEMMMMAERERPSFLEHSENFRFFDKAAIEVDSDRVTKYNVQGEIVSNEVNPWRLCTVRQVEEMKSIVNLVPMWASGVVGGIVQAQAPTYLIQQARTMNRDIGGFNIPPASINVMNTITVLVWLPLFDRYLVPKLIAPLTGHPRGFTYLQKIGIGYALQFVGMAVAVIVEHERRLTARRYGFLDKPHEVIPFSALTLIPQEILTGVASCFSFIGHYEFFYHMVPEHLTSSASALSQSSYALGVLLSSALLNVVQTTTESPSHPGWLDENLNEAHLDYFYIIILFLQFINLTVYIVFIARWYRKQLSN